MTTRLEDLFDPELFMDMEEQGYIRITEHPNGHLLIANYSEKAQYDRVWNDVTRNCRGLIFNAKNEVIARGFPKFFNLSEHTPEEIPDGQAVVSTKFDGSLGILYDDGVSGLYKIATRGSFSSEQAHKGTEILERYNQEIGAGEAGFAIGEFFDIEDVTYLFEILYKENRIVVDYGDQEALVLLDVIDNATGKSRLDLFTAIPWPDKALKSFITDETYLSGLANLVPKGEEGFVLYWPENGFRVKVKSEEYVNLHRIVTGLSEKSVWEMLGEGKTVEQIKENVPDELFDWVDETATVLMDKAQYILDEAYEDFDTALCRVEEDAATLPLEDLDRSQRATFARHAASFPQTRPFLFKMFDRVDHDVLWSMAWKMVKPVGDTRVWNKTTDERSADDVST